MHWFGFGVYCTDMIGCLCEQIMEGLFLCVMNALGATLIETCNMITVFNPNIGNERQA